MWDVEGGPLNQPNKTGMELVAGCGRLGEGRIFGVRGFWVV